jgi:hypothetical protein
MICVFWRYEHDCPTQRRIETFDTSTQANRWVRAMKIGNKRHPEETKIVFLDRVVVT